MERTKKTEYMVKSRSNSSVFSTKPSKKYLWFEVLGDVDTGIRVRIPLPYPPFDDEYSKEISKILWELEESDVVSAVLQREDSSDLWKPVELEYYNQVD